MALGAGGFPVAVTPYYLSLADAEDPACPIRRSVTPTIHERTHGPGEAADPLGEERHTPTPGLTHRYPDRVLFLATAYCSVYCRYCTRSRLVGGGLGAGADGGRGCGRGDGMAGEPVSLRTRWEAGLAYIEARPVIRDVLISGGDPLTLADDALAWLLDRLRAIPHVEIVRIGTKVPAVLPQRVTPALARLLKKRRPVYLSCHMTHPRELTPECAAAFERLADAGVPLGSQTVLLKGVNDDVDTLKALFHGLLRVRVRPYYLYQCDPVVGSAHFRTSVARGLEIMAGLRGHTSGYAVPTYVIDAPGGGGKIPVYPETVLGRDDQGLILQNHEGRVFLYPDAPPAARAHAACEEALQ